MDTTIVELDEPAPDRRARPRRPRQPHPHQHGLGADRGPRLADHGAGLPLDRARTPSTAALELLSAASVWQERGWREALRRLRDAARVRRVRAASGSPSPGATATRPASLEPLIDSRRRWSRTARLVLPLLAALALRRPRRRRLRLRLLERLQGRRRGRAVKLGELAVQRHLLALPQPQRQRGLRLPGRPAAAAGGLDLLRRLLRSPERERRAADAALDADDHRRRPTRPTT